MNSRASAIRSQLLGLTALALAAYACGGLSLGSKKPENLPDEINVQLDMSLGSGPFIYTDAGAGLSDLSSYQSTLTLSFDGTMDGQAATWSRTYTMLATNDPAARQWTIESTQGDTRFLAEINGVEIDKIGDGQCVARAINDEDLLSKRLSLSAFLSGVVGADEAGSETVNAIAANHYTFDQRALAEQDISESTGEMWVATDGGYIVKYLLTTKGKSEYFGDGIEGTVSLDYELTAINQPVEFDIPADCPAGLVDSPQMEDASNVANDAGVLTYTTASGTKAVAAFYQKELPKLGWQLTGEPLVEDATALLQFEKAGETMLVSFTVEEDGTNTVQIVLIPTQ